MHAYPSQMRDIAGALGDVADTVNENVTSVENDAAVAGTGNAGFTTVTAATETATTWIAHVGQIEQTVRATATALSAAADDIEGTDLDSSREIPTAPSTTD